MPLTPEVIEDYAARLDEAERTRVCTGQISQAHPDITLEDGYAIQRAWVGMKTARGDGMIGRKIGLTSRAMQMAVGVDEPDFGALLESMYFEDAAVIPANRFIQPRIEVELGFMLKAPLEGAKCTIFDVLEATDYVVPSFEIIDARVQMKDPETGSTRKVMDTIADNAANAGVIWGGRAVRPTELDLRWVPGVLYQNGRIEETGVAIGVHGGPAASMAWLVRKLAPTGERLEAGQFVLSGSFTRPVFARPGDVFHCDFGPLGQVTCSFAKE